MTARLLPRSCRSVDPPCTWPGAGRTTDLPTLRARDVSPLSPVHVRDLHRSTDSNAAERMRVIPKISPPGLLLPGRNLLWDRRARSHRTGRSPFVILDRASLWSHHGSPQLRRCGRRYGRRPDGLLPPMHRCPCATAEHVTAHPQHTILRRRPSNGSWCTTSCPRREQLARRAEIRRPTGPLGPTRRLRLARPARQPEGAALRLERRQRFAIPA